MAESQIPALPLIAPGAPLTLEMLRDHYNALAKAFNRARPISSADVQTLTTDAGTAYAVNASGETITTIINDIAGINTRLAGITIEHDLTLNCEADPPAIEGDITLTIPD